MGKTFTLGILWFPFLINAQTHVANKTNLDSPVSHGVKFTEGLNWDWLKAKAYAEDKYIFMDVCATWCLTCKKMDKEVYSNDTLGKYMNERFISVKVQIDSSEKDNDNVKSWYSDAHCIRQECEIGGYPSFLFFSPNGKLIYKGLGYKNVSDLIKLEIKALDVQNVVYYAELEDYKKGKKDYKNLDGLAIYAKSLGENKLAEQIADDFIDRIDTSELLTGKKILFVLDVARNKKLANNLAKQYKNNYLDRLSEDDLCTTENMLFISRFSILINSKDNLFHLFYDKPNKIDSIIKYKGWAKKCVEYIITREEIEKMLLNDGRPILKNPDWNKIRLAIHRKYKNVNAGLLVTDYKIHFYGILKDRSKYVKSIIIRVEKYGALGNDDVDFYLNNQAWDVFLYSNNKAELNIALAWCNRALQLNPIANWMDTKANLLYKLGRLDEAIALENKTISLDSKTGEFQDNLEKMKKGQPTWLEK